MFSCGSKCVGLLASTKYGSSKRCQANLQGRKKVIPNLSCLSHAQSLVQIMDDEAREPAGFHICKWNACCCRPESKWRETTVASTGTQLVWASQTIANQHTSLWPARAANSLSEVWTERLPFYCFSVALWCLWAPFPLYNKWGAACYLRPRLPLGPVWLKCPLSFSRDTSVSISPWCSWCCAHRGGGGAGEEIEETCYFFVHHSVSLVCVPSLSPHLISGGKGGECNQDLEGGMELSTRRPGDAWLAAIPALLLCPLPPSRLPSCTCQRCSGWVLQGLFTAPTISLYPSAQWPPRWNPHSRTAFPTFSVSSKAQRSSFNLFNLVPVFQSTLNQIQRATDSIFRG